MRKLHASSASAWFVGPAYAKAEAEFPRIGDETNADDGRRAHDVAEKLIKQGVEPKGSDSEMVTAAKEAINYIHSLVGVKIHCEKSYNVPNLDIKPRIDFWGDSGRDLHVFDYKWGHTPVEADENKQLLIGALAIIHHEGLGRFDRIKLHIIQPRAYHREGVNRSSRWYTRAQITEDFAELLRMRAAVARMENPSCRSGSHCRYCKARGQCAILSKDTRAIYESQLSTLYKLDGMPLAMELAIAEEALEVVRANLSGLTALAELETAQGRPVPGYAMTPGRGSTVWKDPANVLEFTSFLGVDISKDPEPMTPKQAEKILPPKLHSELTLKTKGALKLTKTNPELIAQLFEGQ